MIGSPVGSARLLPRLTALRALAALFVFGYHLQFFAVVLAGVAPLSFGYTGVAFFFILSGFVLTWGAQPDRSRRTFWLRRFARVYPAYLFVLVVAGALAPTGTPPRTPAGTATSVLLMQSWSVHDPRMVYALNPPSWSLSNEAFFYLLLPFLLPLLTALRPRLRWSVAAGWFLATAVVVAVAADLGPGWRFVAFTFPVVRSGEFLIGAVAAMEMRRGVRVPRAGAALVAAMSIVAVAFLPRTTPLPDLWLDPLWLTVVVLAAQADLEERRGWLLTRRSMVYAGSVSFAFYLVHQDVLVELVRWLGRGPGVALASLVVAAVVAMAVHHLVERPMQRVILGARRPVGLVVMPRPVSDPLETR